MPQCPLGERGRKGGRSKPDPLCPGNRIFCPVRLPFRSLSLFLDLLCGHFSELQKPE